MFDKDKSNFPECDELSNQAKSKSNQHKKQSIRLPEEQIKVDLNTESPNQTPIVIENVQINEITPKKTQIKYSKDQIEIINRELRIDELERKIQMNKREYKAFLKEYQKLIDIRDKAALRIKEDELQ